MLVGPTETNYEMMKLIRQKVTLPVVSRLAHELQIEAVRSTDEYKRRRELRRSRKKKEEIVEDEEDLCIGEPQFGPNGEMLDVIWRNVSEPKTSQTAEVKQKKRKKEASPPKSPEPPEPQDPQEDKEALELRLTPTRKGQTSPFAGKVKITEGELLLGTNSDGTLKERLELLTQVSLKSLCRRAGVPVSGKKEELINRLLGPLSLITTKEKK